MIHNNICSAGFHQEEFSYKMLLANTSPLPLAKSRVKLKPEDRSRNDSQCIKMVIWCQCSKVNTRNRITNLTYFKRFNQKCQYLETSWFNLGWVKRTLHLWSFLLLKRDSTSKLTLEISWEINGIRNSANYELKLRFSYFVAVKESWISRAKFRKNL